MPEYHSLIDGIDSTLIDLAVEEIGEAQLLELAFEVADRTFASQQARLESSRVLLRTIFELRTQRVLSARAAHRLNWIRETGARIRLLDSVEVDLATRRERWDDITDPTDPTFVNILLEWAWVQPEMEKAIRESFELFDQPVEPVRDQFFALVRSWLAGNRFLVISAVTNLQMDRMRKTNPPCPQAGTLLLTQAAGVFAATS